MRKICVWMAMGFAIVILAALAACSSGYIAGYQQDSMPEPTPEPEQTIDADVNEAANYDHSHSRVVVFTFSAAPWAVERSPVRELVAYLGEDNVIVRQTPRHPADIYVVMKRYIANPEIEVLIVDSPSSDVNEILGNILQQYDDIFIIYMSPTWGNTYNAHLILEIDADAMSYGFASQAHSMGAQTLVYFYNSGMWTREGLTHPGDSYWQGVLRAQTAELGMNFVEFDTRDLIQCGNSYHMFLSEYLPQLIEKHGPDVVFFNVDTERLFGFWAWRNYDFIFVSRLSQGNNVYLALFDATAERDDTDVSGRIAVMPIAPHVLLATAVSEYVALLLYGGISPAYPCMDAIHQILATILYNYAGLVEHPIALTQDGNRILILLDNVILSE